MDVWMGAPNFRQQLSTLRVAGYLCRTIRRRLLHLEALSGLAHLRPRRGLGWFGDDPMLDRPWSSLPECLRPRPAPGMSMLRGLASRWLHALRASVLPRVPPGEAWIRAAASRGRIHPPSVALDGRRYGARTIRPTGDLCLVVSGRASTTSAAEDGHEQNNPAKDHAAADGLIPASAPEHRSTRPSGDPKIFGSPSGEAIFQPVTAHVPST